MARIAQPLDYLHDSAKHAFGILRPARGMNVPRAQSIAAAIDIGSNSIKMTVARADGGGGIDQFDWASEVVRLGQGQNVSGRLDDERVEIAIQTLRRFEARARELGASQVLAVATEATRSATNGEAFLRRVRKETGISVRVVGGDEEAALTFRGLAASTDMNGSFVAADVGGGSTELIVANDGVMHAARSVPLGSGTLTDRYLVGDPPTRDELAKSEVDAAAAVANATETMPLSTGPNTRLIVVGGTGEFMARLVPDERRIVLETVRQVLSRLKTLTAADLAAELAIPEARARVLPAGVAIVAAVAEIMNPARIEISRSGVRAGMLLEAFSNSGRGKKETLGVNAIPAGTNDEPRSHPNRSRGMQTPREVDPNFRETMKLLIAERWTVVWQAIPVALEGTDIEGVHDVRVASRRLRAAMDIAAPVFSQGWYKSLHRTAKEITGALGEVRDRDVLLEALREDRDAAPIAEHPGIDRLVERIEGERAHARGEMERFLHELIDGPLQSEIERRFGPIVPVSSRPAGTDGTAK